MTRPVVSVTVNGVARSAPAEARTLLSDFLRDGLGLTGTHVGCEHGVCGACTILLDGEAVRSCLLLAVQAQGSNVSTIEGVASSGELHPVQRALADEHGLQCGFCTPGIVMTLIALSSGAAPPSEEMLRDALCGHICRCTGYENVLVAARRALAEVQG